MIRNKINKLFWFSVFSTIFLVLGVGLVFALEVKYPIIPLPGLSNIDLNKAGNDIAPYIGYFFGLGIYLVGVLSLISFTIGAIGLINPSVEAHKEARDRMTGAILGLVLTLVSAIIIQTINPKLATVTSPNASTEAGVRLESAATSTCPDGSACPTSGKCPPDGVPCTNKKMGEPAPDALDDTSSVKIGDAVLDTLNYDCTSTCPDGSACPTNGKCPDGTPCTNPSNAQSKPPYIVLLFPNKNLEQGNNLANVKAQTLNCGNTLTVSSYGSYELFPEVPGVYYYLDSSCQTYGSSVHNESEDEIINPFKGNIKAIKIVNDTKNKIYYGAILHEVSGLIHGGSCTKPITTAGCQAISDVTSPSAIDIFKINQTPATSGDGLIFYGKPFGWGSDVQAGVYKRRASDITTDISPLLPNNMTLDYSHTIETSQYEGLCTYFQASQCPTSGSIYFLGQYLVALYSGTYCQTFTSDVANLGAQPIIASGSGTNLDAIYVIPTPPQF